MALVLGHARSSFASTSYVSPLGNDHASGKSPKHAWRTVSRVNEAHLRPGDTVLFAGGAKFTDSTLMPSASGRAGAQITFSSYGPGLSTISNPKGAIWFSGKSYLVFSRLRLSSAGSDGVIVAGSSAGSSYIAISHCVLSDANSAAINSPSSADSHWTIVGNTIRHVGDSGIILLGANDVVRNNTIEDVGWNPALDYGKHGIYAKGPGVVIRGNRISGFPGSGVTLRFRNARVIENRISGGPTAISFFRDDTMVGTSVIAGNIISDVTRAGFYYDSGGGENFVVSGNSITMLGGTVFDLAGTPASFLRVSDNTVGGSFDYAISVQPSSMSFYREYRNIFLSRPLFAWAGQALSLEQYRAVSGRGTGDRVALSSR